MPLYAEEYLEDRFGRLGARPRAIVRARAVGTSGYEQYKSAIERLSPGAGTVHQAVVEEIKKCAASVKGIANPTERMLAQIECAKRVPEAMSAKGFAVYSRKARRKHRYVPA